MNTRKLHYYLVLALSLLALVGVLTVWETWSGAPLTAQAQGTIRYVATDGTDSGDCTTTPCRTVQYAVDQAASGDEVRVAAGTYTGVQGRPVPPDYPTVLPGGIITQVVYLSRTLSIRGGYTATNWITPDLQANLTTLDAQGRGRVIFVSAGVSPTIEGLSITGGNAARLGGYPSGPDAGGGVFVVRAGATIRNNQVFSNTAYYGGGLSLYESAATLSGNAVTTNTAAYGGGLHVYASPATLSGNAVIANTATWGGGLRVESSTAVLRNNNITANTAYRGGGLSLYGSTPVLSGNTVNANSGGGLYLLFCNAILINNIVADNRTSTGCNALYIEGSSSRLLHNTIVRNSGGDGSGVCAIDSLGVYSAVFLTNTILISHTVGITAAAGNTATLEATLWGDGAWANGTDWGGAGTVVTGAVNLWGGPGFVAPDAGDYHIGPGSAALDAGLDAGVRTDVDGEPRPYLSPDLGADEYWPPGGLRHLYLPLILHQSVPSLGASDRRPPPAIKGSIRYVSGDGADGGDCTAAPCRTVQYAVDQAAAGDEIRVAAGAYTGVQGRPAPHEYPTVLPGGVITQVVYISRTLSIRGGYTTTNWITPDLQANLTTLDAQGRGRVIFVSAGVSPTIEGLRITGGNAARLGGYPSGPDAGGGVFVVRAGATIRNNQVFSNTAYYGGGLSLYESAATLSGNAVTTNTAAYGGGLHVYASPATLSGNAVIANTATWGGGLYLEYCTGMLEGNVVTANHATWGGGLSLYNDADKLSGNTFVANTSDNGGGLYLWASNAALTNNVIADNRASTRGSGLYIESFRPVLLHNTIARNGGGDGSGVYITGLGEAHCAVTLTNTILVSHTVGITVAAGNTATLEATLWGSGAWANGTDWAGPGTVVTGAVNLWGDPGFVAPDAGDYHVGPGSAALDAGVDAGVRTDLDGEPRPYLAPDLGADEYWPPGAIRRIYLPLVLRQSAPESGRQSAPESGRQSTP